MQRVFKTILTVILIAMPLNAADSGLAERFQTIRNEMMQKRTNVKSVAEMRKLITEYRKNCQMLLAEYDVAGLEGKDRETAIGILLESGQFDKAWELLKPVLEKESVADVMLAMGATASFGLGEEERGYELLDRMNRESQEYVMMCLNFAGQGIRSSDPASALPFFERALNSSQLNGQRRYQVLGAYVDVVQLAGDRAKAGNTVKISMERGMVPRNTIGELKRMRRRLELIGQPAPELRNVKMWTSGEENYLKDAVGKPVMLVFFEPGDQASTLMLELIKGTKERVEKDAVQFVGMARPSSLSGLPGKGETADQKGRALQKLLNDVDALDLDFPVALSDARWTWDKYAVRGMAQVVMIDAEGIVRFIVTPQTLPTVFGAFFESYMAE